MDKYTSTRYNRAPTINASRTRFDLSHNILTTCNTGDLVPILVEPVYPGDTFSLRTASLTRLETSLHQTMDNAYIEFAYFFVPLHQVWPDFAKFMGANDDPWTQTTEYTLPQINLLGGVSVLAQSLLNYLGLPTGLYDGDYDQETSSYTDFLSIDATPLYSVFKIYNEWFRDENYDSVVYYDSSETLNLDDLSFLFNGDDFDPTVSTLKVNRYHDLFSTALPAPQKGQEVTISPFSGLLDVILKDDIFDSSQAAVGPKVSQKMLNKAGQGVTTSNATYIPNSLIQSIAPGAQNYILDPNGTMAVDFSQAAAVTINQLRIAIATQAIAERDARGGTRLTERIYSTWNVKAPSLELGRSEFLGGKRFPVSMMEVLQTSETGTTVLGHDAGHSKTLDSSDSFVKSFTDYGWLIGFAFMRTARSYSQGIDRKLLNKVKLDLYDPMLDNIGEVKVTKQEIYALGADGTDGGVAAAKGAWGYQEPWYHLKERLNRFSGFFQPGIDGTLDSWHYGDAYESLPQMSSSWLKEGAEQVDRTIAVTSEAALAFQWTLNVHFELYATREMKKYPVPNTFGFGY